MGCGRSRSQVKPNKGTLPWVRQGDRKERPVSLDTALSSYLNAVVTLRSCDRDVTVGQWKVSQTLCDSLYYLGSIPLQRIYIGSYYEGVPLEVCADNNMLLVNDAFPVVLPDARSRAPEAGLESSRGFYYVLPDSHQENPLYARLVIPPEFATKLDILIQTASCAYGSKAHLSSHLFKTRVTAREPSRPTREERASNSRPGDPFDEVHCLSCPGWPQVATDWLTRPRPRGWPSPKYITQIKKAGCHLVPSGHPRCQERDLQWRWTFSLAERTLVHSLTDTQGSALYLLKALAKLKWGGSESPGITSYLVKTAAFWTFEKYGEETKNISITDLTKKVLKALHRFYSDWNLPHFFIPKQNLINHISQYKCRKVARHIEEVLNLYTVHTLSCLSMGTQTPFYINNIREEIGLSTKPKYTAKDHQTLVKKLPTSKMSVDCLMRVIRKIERGSHDFTTVKRIHVLDAMENIKVDLLNALKQIIKCQQKGPPQRNEFQNGPTTIANQRLFLKRSTSTTKIILSEKEKILEQSMLIFEDTVEATLEAIGQLLDGEQLKSFQLMIRRGMTESYFHLHLLTTATRTGHACLRKATECLESSMNIVYSDGKETFEFDGHFNMALFYYQNCEYHRVIDILNAMHPSPTDSRFVGHIENSVYPITIDTRGTDVELSKWRGDWELYSSIKRRRDTLMVNPAAFAYYMLIQARRVLGYALEELDVESTTSLNADHDHESSSGHISPVGSLGQTNTDEDLLARMQNAEFSYGSEANNMLLKILCE